MMMTKPAPVLITVYDRSEHLRRTVEALSRNSLAEETTVYIASDAPKDETSEEKVELVRQYIYSIESFKRTIPLIRDKNVGGRENARLGWEEIWARHDRAIRMEDDIVTGRGFLRFINDGLDKFCNYENVYGICGYLQRLDLDIHQVYFFMKRFSAWGFGTWREKYHRLMSLDSAAVAAETMRNWDQYRCLNRFAPYIAQNLPGLESSAFRAGDYENGLKLRRYNGYCVYPGKSLVRNIGFDATGVHCGVDEAFLNQDLHDNFIGQLPEYPVRESVRVSLAWAKMVLGHRYRFVQFRNVLLFLLFRWTNSPHEWVRRFRSFLHRNRPMSTKN